MLTVFFPAVSICNPPNIEIAFLRQNFKILKIKSDFFWEKFSEKLANAI